MDWYIEKLNGQVDHERCTLVRVTADKSKWFASIVYHSIKRVNTIKHLYDRTDFERTLHVVRQPLANISDFVTTLSQEFV